MSHRHLVAVLITNEKKLLLGKHMDGPFKGKWGVPSMDASVDRRPMRVALRLAETCSMGLLGSRNTIDLVKLSPSALGLQLYKAETSIDSLPQLLERACGYIVSCFAAGTLPSGLVPWQACKWVDETCDPSGLDPFSQDALASWKTGV